MENLKKQYDDLILSFEGKIKLSFKEFCTIKKTMEKDIEI